MSKTLQGHRTKLDKTKQTKGQNRRQSVVAGRQQLYCAVQSRSPSNCQTTTGNVQSLARDRTSSATVHSWQTTAGCSTHVPKSLGRHGHRALNVWWTVRVMHRSCNDGVIQLSPLSSSYVVLEFVEISHACMVHLVVQYPPHTLVNWI